MSAATDNYVTLDALKHARSQTGYSVADDEGVTAINAAVDAIEQYCNRRFYPDADANQVRQFVPKNSGYCTIDDMCVFTSLVAQDATWVLDRDFYLEPLNAAATGQPFTAIRTIARPFLFTLADRPQGWAVFDGRIQVTGKYGWASCPGAIQGAALLLASRYVTRFRTAPLGIFAGGGADAAAIHLARNDPDVPGLLSPYALTFVA